MKFTSWIKQGRWLLSNNILSDTPHSVERKSVTVPRQTQHTSGRLSTLSTYSCASTILDGLLILLCTHRCFWLDILSLLLLFDSRIYYNSKFSLVNGASNCCLISTKVSPIYWFILVLTSSPWSWQLQCLLKRWITFNIRRGSSPKAEVVHNRFIVTLFNDDAWNAEAM
jgi:hypothetical protein